GHPEGHDPQPRSRPPKPAAPWYQHLGRPLIAALALLLITATLTHDLNNAHAAVPAVVDDAYTVAEGGSLSTVGGTWHLPQWRLRRSITFDNTGRGQLNNFPVLVRLDPADITYGRTKASGQDLRFVDTDGTPLDYEIEDWNNGGVSYVWVRVPQIDAGSTTDSIWMYYDNDAAGHAQNPPGVWSNGYVGVWHMSQDPSGVVEDSSSSGLDLTFSTGMDAADLVSAQIGPGAEFDDDPNYLHTDGSTVSLTSFTLEAWVRPDAMNNWRTLVHIDDGGGTNYRLFAIKNNVPILDEDDDGNEHSIAPNQSGTEGNWRHLAVTYDDGAGSNRLRGYLNGSPTGNNANPNLSSTTGQVILGSYKWDNDGVFYDFLDGTLDEVRISDTPRSADWMAAQHLSMTDAFAAFGTEQEAGVLANDTDPESDPMSAVLADGPAHAASFTLNADGSFDYTPAAGMSGTDSFTYVANDGGGDSAAATVTITVTPTGANNPPNAIDDPSAATDRDVAVVVDVLGNDSDPDVDGLTVSAVTQGTNGSVVNNGSNVTYTPNPGWIGVDSFTYENSDGNGGFDLATVTVTVTDPSTVTVNSTGDSNDNNAGDGTCNTGGTVGSDPECTLRAALEEAIAAATVDTIHFDIPTSDTNWNSGATTFTIAPSTIQLPKITASMTIDATTQPEWAGVNRPVIELDGSSFSLDEDGLDLAGGTIEVRGLAIGDFPDFGIVTSGGSGHVIAGNYIGVDGTGLVLRANRVGISAITDGVTVGGTGADDGNLIVGSVERGINIGAGADGVDVFGNVIGLDAAGSARSNQYGVVINAGATNAQIGGPSATQRNIISGNWRGIRIASATSTGAKIQGNWIGTDLAGTGTVPNTGYGIVFDNDPVGTLVGGVNPGEGNVIRGSGNDGIHLVGGGTDDIAILGNSISGSTWLGIDIDPDGINPNDVGDGDTGTNGLLNYPVITSATESGGTVSIDFDLDVPDGSYRIEFFANPGGADPSGNGEGETLAGTVDVSVVGGTPTPSSTSFAGSTGDIITTTVTEGTAEPFGSTSEFSAAVTVTAGACADSDGDGLCDLEEDANTDADGNPATNPGPNTDGDANPNYLDADDDGDGTLTVSENADPNGDGDPRDALDADWDGQPDYLDAPTIGAPGFVVAEQKISDLVGGLGAILDNDDFFGAAVASIGDVDGDGTTDVAVSAVGDDDGSSGAGSIHVLFLNPSGAVKAEQKISATQGGLSASLGADERFGRSVAGIGDLDGDGVPDIAVGAVGDDDGGTDRGAVHILFLNTNGTVKAEQKISDTQGGLYAAFSNIDLFGAAVAGIGDLDGDGIRDLAVGAVLDDDGGLDRGAVHILFLNTNGTVKAEQKISDTQGGLNAALSNDDRFGRAIAGLGDMDGDGVLDIAVTALHDDDGGTNRGAAYVLFLNPDGTVKGEQKISDLVGGFGTALDDDDRFGRSMASVGDIDADGTTDLVVGAISDDDGGTNRGALYVLFLNPSGTVKGEQKISDLAGGLATPLDDGDNFGGAVAGIGDLDGDGRIDLASGAMGDDDGGTNRGALYVMQLGDCTDTDGDGLCDLEEDANTDADSNPATNPGPNTDGDANPNYLDADDDGDGTATASEDADPNGDGDPKDALDSDLDGQADYLDLPTAASDGTVGSYQKISDTTGGFSPALADNDFFGGTADGIGDIDGDGVNDMVVGAYGDDDGGTNRGAVYILFMNADGTVRAEQKISDTAGGFTATLDNSDHFGLAADGLGDIDGDGIGDIIVGANLDDDGGGQRGAAYVVFLNSNGTARGYQKISSTEGSFGGTLDDSDWFGVAVGGIGDVDGDGTNDAIVGASYDDDGASGAGAVYIVLLNPDGTVKAEQKLSASAGGFGGTLNGNDFFGAAVAGIGDLDGDGTPDVVVGAYGDDDGGTDRGAAYILFLNANGTVKAEQKISDTAGGFTAALGNDDELGGGVSGAGDIDGDGTLDVVIGAGGDGDGGGGRGAAYVVFLNSNGTVKGFQKISDTAGNFTATLDDYDVFGTDIGALGDLDGDGVIDIVVTAKLDDDGGNSHGAAYVLNLAPALVGYSISGTVFEDIAGDVLNDGVVGDASNPGAENVDVHLYLDVDGDGVAEATDTFQGTTQTDANGDYSFPGLSNGKYFVVVDSLTIQPGAGIDTGGGWLATDVWAEQTYGPSISECADGIGGTINDPTAGPCYGGRRSGVSDDLAIWHSGAEHLAKTQITNANVSAIDFGFSFNVVTTVVGGDSQDDDPAVTLRSVQGSMRQFIQNANSVSGPNAMRFVPAEGPNAKDTPGNQWWRVAVTTELPVVRGAQTVIDGTAYYFTDGTSVWDANPTMLGTGGTVGVEGVALGQVAGPELELLGDGVVNTGLRVTSTADNSTVRRLAISRFFFDGLVTAGGLNDKLTGILVEESVLGSGPSEVVDPGAGNRQYRSMYAYYTLSSGTIRNNLIGFAETDAFAMSFAARDLLVEGNEIRGGLGSGISISYSTDKYSGDITVRGNLLDGNAQAGLDMYRSYGSNMVENNTITNNGADGWAGIVAWGTGNTITKNVITDNVAAGTSIVGDHASWSASNNNLISQNVFGNNGGLAIDLVESNATDTVHLAGDGVTLTAGTLATTGNNGLDAPVIATASMTTVTGTACSGCTIEVYKAIAGGGDSARGEGVEFVGTTTADGAGDWTLSGITTLTLSDKVTTIAIDASNDTSEFSFNAVVAGSLVVNSTGDQSDIVPGDGKCSAGVLNSQSLEACTLRAAIEEANALPGADTITFGIPTSEPGYSGTPLSYTIGIAATGLPPITGTVTIDGTSQTGFAGSPIVELNGTGTNVDVDGLVFSTGSNGSTVRGIVINRFADDGIGGTADSITVAGTYIGTNVSGTTDLGNGGDGIQADGNTWIIGGTDAADRNVISGNTDDGVQLFGDGHTVLGNYIGTTAAGTGPIANTDDGVEVASTSTANVLGGTAIGARNVISGNGGEGVLINISGSNQVLGNYIGVDATGSAALGNSGNGVTIQGGASGNTVGGSTAAHRNVISGNTSYGIDVVGVGTDSNTVLGNYIGTDPAGTADLGNGSDGVAIRDGAQLNVVGGTNAGDRNVISGNDNDGVWITGTGTEQNVVEGNWIGAAADGSSLGNSYHGVAVEFGAANNLVGGTTAAAGNRIENNAWDGIAINGGNGTGNAILRNIIVGNIGLGIDIDNDGVTPNDPGDGDTGDNDLLNFPVITSAVIAAPWITVDYDIDAPAGDYLVEFFSNPSGIDPSGHGEGEAYEYGDTISHPGGAASYTAVFSGFVGDELTATLTHDAGPTYGSTSEFSAAATVVLPNSAPSASDDGYGTLEDAPLSVNAASGVLDNDTDPETDPLTATLVAPPGSAASFTLNPDGSFAYTPVANFNGTDTFTYRAYDGALFSTTATVTITVAAVNDEPGFTTGGNVTVLEDSGAYSAPWATSITAGPANEAAQTVTFTVIGNTNAGLFATQPGVSPTGVLTFTPAANAFGSADITIELSDNGGVANGGDDTSPPVVFTITVDPDNDAPIAADDAYGTIEDTTLNVTAPGVLGNDSDIEGDGLTATLITPPGSAASFTLNPDGSFDYTPAADFNGTDTFTYRAYDGSDFSTTATATITVTPVNDEPAFTPGGNVTVAQDSGPYSAAWATGITAGPADEAGQSLTFTITSNTNPGLFGVTPSVASNGSLTFTPAAATSGSADITIELGDDGGIANGGNDTSAPLVFTITVTPQNAPVANDDAHGTLEDTPLSVNAASGVLDNDTDPELDPLTATLVAGPGSAQSFALNPDGSFDYTPIADFNGTDSFTYRAHDGLLFSTTATVTITVTAVNDEPGFTPAGNVTVLEDSGAYSTAWATGISAGPADESGQALAFNVIGNTNPSLFSVAPSVSPTGLLAFTPAANAYGTANITIELSDNGGVANGGDDTSPPVVFTITVDPDNDAPIAVDDAYGTLEDTPLSVNAASGVLDNDTDIEGDGLTATLITPPGSAASFTLNPDGSFDYTPAADFNGTDTFTY
ncbi:MAG: DUF2341 domain-containing protein, partial [Acidimicrobiia bacterium]|nr:DUF2341 domain-containing protein [Acidimicrobiia bacterium]